VSAELSGDVLGTAPEEVVRDPLLADRGVLPDLGRERDFVWFTPVALPQIGRNPAEPMQSLAQQAEGFGLAVGAFFGSAAPMPVTRRGKDLRAQLMPAICKSLDPRAGHAAGRSI